MVRHVAVCLSVSAFLMSSAVARAADGPRMKFCFNPDWKFIQKDVPAGEAPSTDDVAWTTVSCPHTFNDVDTFDDLSPGGHIGELHQWAGRTWYRKHFTPDAAWADKKVFIEFEGVRQVAEIYINGKRLGIEKSGFTPFGFDLTTYLQFGKENVIAVMADNTFVTHGKDWSKEKVDSLYLPWNDPHWHPAHGGIYRNVFLHVMNKVHVTLPLYSNLGTEGTYAYAEHVSKESADVGVEVQVQNETDAAAPIEATSDITDEAGKVVLSLTGNHPVAPGEKFTFTSHGTLPHPELWGPGHPYLYTVVTTLRSNGAVVDSCRTPLGVRSAVFSKTDGLTFNGSYLKLHGFGQKPTDEWPGLGAAQPDWLHDYTIKMMQDDGGNFIRWGHCAAGPSMIASSDKYGIITYQPGVDGEKDCLGESWDVRAAAFRDMLIYFRNNPSIVIWEAGNQKVTEDHIQQLVNFRKQYDPHGGRALTERRASPMNAQYLDIITSTENNTTTEAPKEGEVGYNPSEKKKSIQITTLPQVEGEYDREESPRRVWDDKSPRQMWGASTPPIFGYPEAKGMTYDLTGEQFAVNMAENWEPFLAHHLCGGAKWIFSDTTSGGRLTCEVARVSGEVDGARLPKDAFYAIKAIYSETPQVFLLAHWTYPANTTKTVYAMSNADEVELRLNGKSLGKNAEPSHHFVFAFKDVAFAPGTLEAVAYKGGKEVARHQLKTAGAPKSIRLTPITGPTGLRADGSDVVLVDAEVVDADGNRCPTFYGRIDFTTTGPAIWRGGYNSGKADSINKPFLDLECGINRVALRSTLTPGKIHVHATIPNLDPGDLDLDAKPVVIDHGVTTEMPATPPAPRF